MIPKFRAWDTYEEEMLENVTPLFDDSNSMMAIITDFQIKGSPGTSEIEIGSYDTTFNWDEFPYILMQSTGLKDKNGVEIFEGDVLYYIPFESHINDSIVVFEKGSFCTQMLRNGKLTSVRFIDSEEYEVIGNIHENPELLEGAE
ncbi:YopX family protein [Enterococcus faecalis]|uniref:YopX family protein n=1 Tax=Enterococcus faecalis TaxID=1351 RepID=UPI003F3EA1FA